jgi:hypothetical protein
MDSRYAVLAVLAMILVLAGGIIWLLYRKIPKDGQRDFEVRRLYFAAVTLAGLALLFILSTALYYWDSSTSGVGKDIFDTSVQLLPPIATLVIGYYFGKSDAQASAQNESESDTSERRLQNI